MREVIKTAKTVEEAKALAIAELGVNEEDALVEVLELPQRRLFKTIPAKVRASVEEPEEAPKAPEAPKPAPAPKAEKPAPRADKPAPKAPKAEAPKAPKETKAHEVKPEEAPAEPKAAEPEEIPVAIESVPKLAVAVEYLRDICGRMADGELTFDCIKTGETYIVRIDGEGAGALIGHRGEVMESLSYLASLAANRTEGDYLKLGVDVNHYRSKREENLTALARRIGAKVARTGRSHAFEPMNPYERRIIHAAIGAMEGVTSESTGEGANRRVVVSSTGENARPFRQAGRGGKSRGGKQGGRGGRGRGGDRGERREKSSVPGREFADRPRDPSAAPTAAKRTETINDGADLPLYGKITL